MSDTKEKTVQTMLETKCEFSTLEAVKMVGKLGTKQFFTAPASTKYHGAYVSGLYCHSVEVMHNLVLLTEKLNLQWENPRSPYIVGLFHDLCKCDQYMWSIDDDKYIYNPNMLLDGHGEKSIIVTQSLGIDLTEEEMACIRWHMGAFDDKENWKHYTNAIKKYPNVLWTHTADMMASHIYGI